MRLAVFLFIITSTSACNDYSRASYVLFKDNDMQTCKSMTVREKNESYRCECIKGFSIAGYTGVGQQVTCVQD